MAWVIIIIMEIMCVVGVFANRIVSRWNYLWLSVYQISLIICIMYDKLLKEFSFYSLRVGKSTTTKTY